MPRFDPDEALRPPLRALSPYQPIDPPEEVAARYGIAPEAIVKLDGNENPYGPSPRARAALAAVDRWRRGNTRRVTGHREIPSRASRR